MRTIVAGNWKMNADRDGAAALVDALVKELPRLALEVEAVIAPPFPFLHMAVEKTRGTGVIVAAQNCHEKESGAYTGEVSAAMLRSIGVGACIVGHSERRQCFAESDALIGQKIAALLALSLIHI